jgi:Zinc knuckle
MNNIRSLTGIKTDSNKIQTKLISFDTKDIAAPISIPPPKPNPKPTIATAHQRLNQIREYRRRGIITCYRCSERNHSSTECRNALVCFACGRLGHRSNTCQAITLKQNPNPAPKPLPNQPIPQQQSSQLVQTATNSHQPYPSIPKI